MTTKREDIMLEVLERLSTITEVDGRIYRSRVDAVGRAEMPLIVLEQIQTTPQSNDVLGVIDWRLDFRVVVITGGAAADAVADPIIDLVYKKLLDDESLGGKVLKIRLQTILFQTADGDQNVCVAECIFECTHRTSTIDLGA